MSSEKQDTAKQIDLVCADCGLPIAGSTPRSDVTRYLSETSRCQCRQYSTVQPGQAPVDALPNTSAAVAPAVRLVADLTLADAREILKDKFEILELLGQGGMGSVFKARERATGTIFAVKLLNPALLQHEDSRKRFEREAKASMQIHDANVAAVYSYGIGANETPYLVMDFLEGKTLDQLLKETPKLDYKRVINLSIQICDGLEQAHSRGVVHRDLKPSNIMITTPAPGVEFAKIFDFGIAKVMPGQAIDLTVGDMTKTGDICGSPLYMAPEQVQDNNVDQRSDLHALGCVMYKALTGVHPFEGKNVLDTVAKILTSEAHPLSLVTPAINVPDSLSFVVEKCLNKSPNMRYSNAAELRKDLEGIRDGNFAPPKPRPAVTKFELVAIALMFVLLLTGVCAAISWRLQFDRDNRNNGSKPATALASTDPYKDAERLDQLSYTYFVNGDYERAIPLLEFGIKTYKANGAKKVGMGREDNYLAENLSHLGKCYLKLGKYAEAVSPYKESLQIFRRWGNYGGGMMTEAVNDYADVLRGLSRSTEAEEMLRDYAANNNLKSVP
ncbi:MAG: serine/threonine-protein kinase [Candidatus Obscuribacterales bacterium]|nr:serine/threonine-protein kinase [Candidatus Obscuribacterales bacterium]